VSCQACGVVKRDEILGPEKCSVFGWWFVCLCFCCNQGRRAETPQKRSCVWWGDDEKPEPKKKKKATWNEQGVKDRPGRLYILKEARLRQMVFLRGVQNPGAGSWEQKNTGKPGQRGRANGDVGQGKNQCVAVGHSLSKPKMKGEGLRWSCRWKVGEWVVLGGFAGGCGGRGKKVGFRWWVQHGR